MAVQVDLVTEEQEARIRAAVNKRIQSENGRLAVLAVLVPCGHCGRGLTRREAAEVYGLTFQRVSQLTQRVEQHLGLPARYSEEGKEARHRANRAARGLR